MFKQIVKLQIFKKLTEHRAVTHIVAVNYGDVIGKIIGIAAVHKKRAAADIVAVQICPQILRVVVGVYEGMAYFGAGNGEPAYNVGIIGNQLFDGRVFCVYTCDGGAVIFTVFGKNTACVRILYAFGDLGHVLRLDGGDVVYCLFALCKLFYDEKSGCNKDNGKEYQKNVGKCFAFYNKPPALKFV